MFTYSGVTGGTRDVMHNISIIIALRIEKRRYWSIKRIHMLRRAFNARA